MVGENLQDQPKGEEKHNDTFWGRNGSYILLGVLVVYVILLGIGTFAELTHNEGILNWWIFRRRNRAKPNPFLADTKGAEKGRIKKLGGWGKAKQKQITTEKSQRGKKQSQNQRRKILTTGNTGSHGEDKNRSLAKIAKGAKKIKGKGT